MSSVEREHIMQPPNLSDIIEEPEEITSPTRFTVTAEVHHVSEETEQDVTPRNSDSSNMELETPRDSNIVTREQNIFSPVKKIQILLDRLLKPATNVDFDKITTLPNDVSSPSSSPKEIEEIVDDVRVSPTRSDLSIDDYSPPDLRKSPSPKRNVTIKRRAPQSRKKNKNSKKTHLSYDQIVEEVLSPSGNTSFDNIASPVANTSKEQKTKKATGRLHKSLQEELRATKQRVAQRGRKPIQKRKIRKLPKLKLPETLSSCSSSSPDIFTSKHDNACCKAYSEIVKCSFIYMKTLLLSSRKHNKTVDSTTKSLIEDVMDLAREFKEGNT